MDIVIVGAGDMALCFIDEFRYKKDVKYFYDKPRVPNEERMDKPVKYEFTKEYIYISVVGDPRHKRVLIDSLPKTTLWGRVVHIQSCIVDTATMLKDVVVYPFVNLHRKSVVGNHVLIVTGVNVGHNTVIGDYCTLTPYVLVAGNVVLEDGVFMGAGSKVLSGVTIGEGSIIGAGALITEDVEPNSVMVGMPAKPIKSLESW